MAKSGKGMFGAFSGRIGNTVYYMRKGQQVARTIGYNNKSPTFNQLHCWQRLRVLSAFLKPMKLYVQTGFANLVQGTDMYPYNAAVKYNLKRATKGQYPEVVMDYEKVLLSKGSLHPAKNVAVIKEAEGIRFRWDTDDLDYQNRSDNAMLLIYFPETQEALCWLNAAQREQGEHYVAMQPQSLAQEMHCYLAFIAAGRNEVSDSVYAPVSG